MRRPALRGRDADREHRPRRDRLRRGRRGSDGEVQRPRPGPQDEARGGAAIPTAKLGEAILTEKPNKINVWYSQTCAPIGQWPNTKRSSPP